MNLNHCAITTTALWYLPMQKQVTRIARKYLKQNRVGVDVLFYGEILMKPVSFESIVHKKLVL